MCRFITQSELQHLSDDQLHALFNEVSREDHSNGPGAKRCRAALANLETVRRAIAQRTATPRLKPPGF